MPANQRNTTCSLLQQTKPRFTCISSCLLLPGNTLKRHDIKTTSKCTREHSYRSINHPDPIEATRLSISLCKYGVLRFYLVHLPGRPVLVAGHPCRQGQARAQDPDDIASHDVNGFQEGAGGVPPAHVQLQVLPRSFRTARALGGHQKAHTTLQRARRNSRKAHMSRRPAWYSVASALRSAYLHAWPFDAWHIHYDPSVPLSFPWQTGTGPRGLAPAQPSSAVLGNGYGRNGVGRLRGRKKGMSIVNQEETPNGIDLTLKL